MAFQLSTTPLAHALHAAKLQASSSCSMQCMLLVEEALHACQLHLLMAWLQLRRMLAGLPCELVLYSMLLVAVDIH
jgi:hypothetical protein